MPRARFFTIPGGALIGAFAIVSSLMPVGQGNAQEAGSVAAQATAPADGGPSELTLPGGVRAALAVLKDYNPPDRSQFLVEVIPRVHHLAEPSEGPRDATLVALLAHLDAAAADTTKTTADTLPLPLTPQIWIDVVFGGRATPTTLASAILRSRGASLLYSGLLSLDDRTSAFVGAEPGLLNELSARLAAPFVIAAPAVRVGDRRVDVPGGEPAIAAWEALVGRRVSEPVEFLRALLAKDGGRLAWFYGSIGQLTPAQIEIALELDASDAAARVESVRRMYDVFVHVAGDWRLDGRTFWRPPLDPALLAAWLPPDERGRPQLPATQGFWSAVFAGNSRAEAARLLDGGPPGFVWLCERVFDGDPNEHRPRAHQVLLASRLAPRLTRANAVDAAEVVRASTHYPALIGVLERLRITDLALIARTTRRAASLSAINDVPRAVRALAQFQGLLALMARAGARGGLAAAAAHDLVDSLVAVELGPHGDYEGRLVQWLDQRLPALARQPATTQITSASAAANAAPPSLERTLIRVVAGEPSARPRRVDWEGTQYVVDLASAESARIERLLGDEPRPWLSSAKALVALADSLGDGPTTAAVRTRAAATFAEVSRAVGWSDAEQWRSADTAARVRDTAAALQRSDAGGSSAARTRSTAAALRVLADELCARGLLELTYATALGQPERAWISADEAARGHDFGLNSVGTRRTEGAWRRPVAGADTRREWRATGSLLGLDISLAELSLVRLSARPPPRRPSLNEEDRRVIVENVALVEPVALSDADLERMVLAMEIGRTRLDAAKTRAEALALGEEIRLSPTRRNLLAWVVAHDPTRTSAFLAPVELLWLGLDRQPVDAAFHAWGSPAEASLGCLCLRVIDRQPWEALGGRWGTGVFAGAFPDLNLRIGELLVARGMPAALLGPVLASAALDLVNTTASRGQDDRRSLVEFVQAMTPERMERYLALLTTDGPLVPVGESEDAIATRSSGVPR